MAVSEYPETARALLNLADAVATDTPVVRRAESKGLAQGVIRKAVARIDAEIPKDDGVPPGAPTGVSVEAGMRQLIVSWDEPPSTDWIEQTRVITSRDSTAAIVRTQYVRGRSVTVPDLPSYRANGTTRESYVVKVVHFDRWGRQSAITQVGPTLPLLSASEEVDLAKLAILGRLRGELPNSNLATIQDAILLGTGVVQARSMTSMDAAAINLWVQNAAIEDAKVKSMRVDKLLAGSLVVDTNIVGSGKIRAAGSSMGPLGMELSDTANSIGSPSDARGSWLTPPDKGPGPNPYAGIGFFYTDVAPFVRGINIRADGAAVTNRDGMVRLMATNGNQNNDSVFTAVIQMKSSSVAGTFAEIGMKENVNINRDLYVVRNLRNDQDLAVGRDGSVGRNLAVVGDLAAGGEWKPSISAQGLVGANGGALTINHGTGRLPNIVNVMVDTNGNGSYRPASEVPGIITSIGLNAVTVRNNDSTATYVHVRLYR